MKPACSKEQTREGGRRLPLFSIRTRLAARVLCIAALTLLTGFAAWPSQLAFTVTKESGRLAYAVPVQPGDGFAIRFIHSVHRTPVEEHFRISSQGELVLERVVFESYGVGNPSGTEPGERFFLRDGKLVIEGMDRRWHAIVQRIGQKVANHELLMNGQDTPFTAWSEPGSKVLLEVKRVSRWSLWNQ